MLVAFSQFPNATELCRTCLLSLAANANVGEGALAAAAADLLLLLHRDGPLLSSDAWLPMRPILQNLSVTRQSAAATELLQRLGEVMGAAPQQFGTSISAYQGHANGNSNGYPSSNGQAVNTRNAQGAWGVLGGQSGALNHQGGYTGAHPQAAMQQANGMQQSQWNTAPAGAMEPPPEPGKANYNLTPPCVGLQNIQNTCYVNTVVQSLFMTNSFVHDIYNFHRRLKNNASVVDKEDHEMGRKIVKMLQRSQ